MILYMITAINKKIRGSGGLGLIAPIALLMICLAVGCSPPDPVHSEVIRPVKTMVVAAGEEARERSFSGRVEASKTADLAFSVPGLLVKLPVKEGQRVAKGELIAQLREDEFKARLQTLQGQFDQALAALRRCKQANDPRRDCGGNRRCGRPRPGSRMPEPNLIAMSADSIPSGFARGLRSSGNGLSRGPGRSQGGPAVARKGHDWPRGRH